MQRSVVHVVDTGVANIASVSAFLARAGFGVRRTRCVDEIAESPAVVLPGVGAFAAGAAALRESGADRDLKRRVEEDLPTLAICLGMQLFCARSEEGPGESGLGIVGESVSRLPSFVRVPHFGWNQVTEALPFIPNGFAYFANSFALLEAPPGWDVSWTEHGVRFVSAMSRGKILATQFHPELSGNFGKTILENWMEVCAC